METARYRALFALTLSGLLASCGGGGGDSAAPTSTTTPTIQTTTPAVARPICDPLTFGAVADGKTDNTSAIQTAIDSCATQGGGMVELVARGSNAVYVTGPIVLKSHVHLHIDEGVTLQSTNDHSRFVPAYVNWVYRPNEALISANGATDVAILGDGTIDGAADTPDPNDGGRTWHDVSTQDSIRTLKSLRPWLLEFYLCDQVTVSGVTLQNYPYWAQAFRFSSNITETGVTIRGWGRNSDGLDLVGVTNATITDLDIRDSDDFIAVKSGLAIRTTDYDYELQKDIPQRTTSNVHISNITARDGQGISIGSEAINGVHDVTIENVDITNSRGGFRIKTGRDRGSEIYNIRVNNFVMHGGNWPIIVDSYYSTIGSDPIGGPAEPVTGTTPHVHDIYISNLVGNATSGQSYIHGLPESCIKNVMLDNVKIETYSTLGMDLAHMTGSFNNVTTTFISDTDPSPPQGPPFVVAENVTVATTGTTPQIVATPPLASQTACN
jgi:polygalacturonase